MANWLDTVARVEALEDVALEARLVGDMQRRFGVAGRALRRRHQLLHPHLQELRQQRTRLLRQGRVAGGIHHRRRLQAAMRPLQGEGAGADACGALAGGPVAGGERAGRRPAPGACCSPAAPITATRSSTIRSIPPCAASRTRFRSSRSPSTPRWWTGMRRGAWRIRASTWRCSTSSAPRTRCSRSTT
ncbi:MAG: hypothetical protein MZV65_48500 [Chromatiales bacterium]|nr:hypothetical protein [Chromatiales bacterium]